MADETSTYNIQQEHTKLLSTPPTTSSATFVIASTWMDEVRLTAQPCLLIALQLIVGYGTIVISIIMVGQLPNSALYLSGVGLASTFVNVTGVAITWGFTTALFTLLPQSIGAGQTRLTSIYVQRSFLVVTAVSILLSIIQFFAGDILIAIGQPAELKEITNTYSRILLPYIFLCGYAAICERTMQAFNLNLSLFGCYLFQFLVTPPFTYLFMYTLDCGYYGAAIARSLTQFLMIVAEIGVLLLNDYAYLFVPHSLSLLANGKGLKEYIYLALPGLFQNAFEWIIEELAVILAGYVVQPQIAVSTAVILSNVFNVTVLSCSISVGNGTNLRVAKYIGYGSIFNAKRAAFIGVCIAMVVVLCNFTIFVTGRRFIPSLFTDNPETIALTSQTMLLLIGLCFGCVMLQTVAGIYRGLGQQKIAAVIVFVSYWLIALPIGFVLLFALGWRRQLYSGMFVIIGNLTVGNLLSAFGVTLYLLCCIDWKHAVLQSQHRVKQTIKEYQATATAPK